GDGGGGEFYWDNVSTLTDNGGTIIKATPATGRWIRVFQQPVNVQWFGAKGDGSTDDTTNINNAIGAITAGEVVFVPGLTYVISGTLTISNPLTVDLSGATLQFASSVSTTNVAAFTISHDNVTVRNGIVNGTYSPGTDVPSPGVGPYGVNDSGYANTVIDRITIQNVQSYGINTANATNLRIVNCRLINTGYISIFCNNTTAGLAAGLVSGNVIDRSGIPANHITQPCVAIRGSSTTNYTAGLIFSNNKITAQLSPTDATAACMELRYMNGCTADNNIFTYGAIGLSIVRCYNVSATANTCFSCGYGIEIADGSFNTLDANVINGNSTANTTGILLDGTTNYATFNTISNNNISSVTLSGIEVYKGSANNNIIGGQITNPTSGQSCINILGAQSTLITGVVMDGLTTGSRGVMMDSSAYSSNTSYICSGTIINGCTFYNFASAAMTIYSPNGGTLTGLRFSNNMLNSGTMLSTTYGSGASNSTPYYYGNSPELIGSKVILATGTNASAGTATLVAGTVTVSNTLVTASSLILLSVSAVGGTQGMLSSTKVAGTSFTITSSSATDTSTVAWVMVN
ncbi:MAG: right-handed parallel beta-helix repeat-containing protein, partial [Bacteroidetes bacterium]|nr:right-handed parallel beta-helix repeat-containing protein [Bacteroidota bacterium]